MSYRAILKSCQEKLEPDNFCYKSSSLDEINRAYLWFVSQKQQRVTPISPQLEDLRGELAMSIQSQTNYWKQFGFCDVSFSIKKCLDRIQRHIRITKVSDEYDEDGNSIIEDEEFI